jgi:hypothetical protein
LKESFTSLIPKARRFFRHKDVVGKEALPMMTRGKEYERKLKQHRGRGDRASILEERLQANRSAGLAQKEREVSLAENCDAGTDASYQHLSEKHNTAVTRATRILGPGAVKDQRSQVRPALAFATGIPSLDIALGGGIPCGITEIYGAESVGKSTLMMEMIRSAQDQHVYTALCPTEIFDWERARKIGVDLEELMIIQGKDERVLSAAADYLEGDNRVLFIDSATGIRPETGSWWLAMLSWFEGMACALGENSGVVMTNQVRVRRSVDPRKFFAGGTDSTAHRIAGCFDVRMELSRENVTVETYDMVINLVANLYNAPHQIVTLPVIKREGIDVWRDVVRVAARAGVLEERAAHYYYLGTRLGHGETEASKQLAGGIGNEVFNKLLQVLTRR